MTHEHTYGEPIALVVDMTHGNTAQRLYAPRARPCPCGSFLLEPVPYVEPVLSWWRRLIRRLLRRSSE